jgi:peroxiredoxin family protein
MAADPRLCVLFHAGDYDRIYHGLSLAGTAAARGREVHLFFTYWALKRLVKGQTDKTDSAFINQAVAEGHMKPLTKLIDQVKKLGEVHIYACSGSMALMNVAREELIEQVDQSMGLAGFESLWEGANVVFI